MKSILISLLSLFLLTLSVEAQKKAIGIEDYGRFRSINSISISEEGNWVGFSYSTPRKDDTLHIENVSGEKKYTIPLGSSLKFSDDEEWAAYDGEGGRSAEG